MMSRLRSLWRGLWHRSSVEAEMLEEFEHHISLREEDLVRRGVTRGEAARQARLEFGHVETHRETGRASRRLNVLDRIGFSVLDAKLGFRMVMKYPWLSGVSVLGMAVAIAIGAGGFAVISAMLDPTLPLPGGERLVSIQNLTSNPGNPERRLLHDYFVWQDQLRSVEHVSALLAERRTLTVEGQAPEVVQVARMSTSGFEAAGVRPLLGGTPTEADDQPGAAPVLVIGHEEWQRRFDGSEDVLGRTVNLGGVTHTIIGVMPPGYRFPINHEYWVPLRLERSAYTPLSGPGIHVFGRLAEGATLEQAQAELETVAGQLAALSPDTHEWLRPRVMAYTRPFFDVDDPGMVAVMHSIRVFISLLLVLVAVNVGMLIYARTVTRASELVVRTALGASRLRIVTQLFVEALVLSATSAAIGLGVASFGLAKLQQLLTDAAGGGRGELPFWLRIQLTPGAILYVVGLAVLAAVIVGVLPALRATGRNVQGGLQQISMRGSRMELGRTWTLMIVGQVALAVAILPFVLHIAGTSLARGMDTPPYAGDRMLQAFLGADSEEVRATPPSTDELAEQGTLFAVRATELLRRLEAEPSVEATTWAAQMPGSGSWHVVEVEGSEESGSVVANDVAPNLFDVYEVPVLAGRGFEPGDMRPGADAVIVDRPFVDRYLADGAVIGRRIRLLSWDAGEQVPGPWMQVVGVVPNFTFQNDFDPMNAHVYRAADLQSLGSGVAVIVRTVGVVPPTLPRLLSEHAAAVDATLRVEKVMTVQARDTQLRRALFWLGVAMAALVVSVLLLSAAGIYAMMSFTVARRRREIGIRSALGANPRRLIAGVFARASAQLGGGVLVGLLLALAMGSAMGLRRYTLVLLLGMSLIMMVVGLLAALGPARSSLRIHPTEAFRSE